MANVPHPIAAVQEEFIRFFRRSGFADEVVAALMILFGILILVFPDLVGITPPRIRVIDIGDADRGVVIDPAA